MMFDNSYARLPDRFFARVAPARPPAPALIEVNRPLAVELGIDPDWLLSPEGLEFLSGRTIVEGSEPIALAYAGHQFGNFVPQLGDGRAILLGELVDSHGRRRDVQLKGAGRTPYSRNGDGRAALGPVLREYLVSEAMAALGVPTTRALAAVTTGDQVVRETMLPGAILTRVASSHIRVGTFQFFAARGDEDALRLLADHVIARHYPEAAAAPRPWRAMLDAIIARQAALVARWLTVGFIHGVMNTDNMSIAGETIDYGPCAFMDSYDPATVYSSIDSQGRYAYANQPRIALWNLTRLAEAILPLLADQQTESHHVHVSDENGDGQPMAPDPAVADAEDALRAFAPLFQAAWIDGLRGKLGLGTAQEGDADLANSLLSTMTANQVDFTLFFRRLSRAQRPGDGDEPLRELFIDPTACDAWLTLWRNRLADEATDPAERQSAMDAVNPVYIPRNHQVEGVIRAAVDRADFAPFEALLAVVQSPYDEQSDRAVYSRPPEAHEAVTATFCGT